MNETLVSRVLVYLLLGAALLPMLGGCGAPEMGSEEHGHPEPVVSATGLIDLAAMIRSMDRPGLGDEAFRRTVEQAEEVVREYLFEGTRPREGWQAWKDFEDFDVSDGMLRVKAIGEDLQLAVAPDFDCRRVQRVLVRARVSRGSRGFLFWMTRDKPIYDGKRSQQFWLHPGEAFKTYTIEVGEHDLWDGEITGLRLDPTDKPGTVEIDSVILMAGHTRLETDLLAARCGLPEASLALEEDRRLVTAVTPGDPVGLDLHLPGAPGPDLRFAIGLVAAGADGRETVPAAAHRFLVRTAAGRTLFDQRLDPVNRPSHRGWVEARVPLDGIAGKSLGLVFAVEPEGDIGNQDCCAAFANPRIHLGPGDKQTNLLVILVDTLRADHLSCYGYRHRTTPHLDRLRRESVLFRQAVASSSWTAPSVASLFTGLHPYRHGVRYVDTLYLDPGFETVAERFSTAGWFTGAISDNMLIIPENGYDQGFRTYVSKPAGLEARKAKAVTDLALDWLEHHGDQPFYLYLHYMDPHGNYQPGEPFHPGPAPTSPGSIRRFVEQGKIGTVANKKRDFKKFRLNPGERQRLFSLYDGEIAANDFQLGRLLAWLEKSGILDNTIVVFVADHGEEFADHGKFAHATSLYDELVRVPLLIRLPGHLERGSGGQGRDAVVRLADLGPTLLDLASVSGFDEQVEAMSFRGLLESQPNVADPREIYLELNPYSRAPLQRGWIEATRGLRLGDLKLIYEPRTKSYRLFNLVLDPGERRSIFNEADPQSKQMVGLLARYLDEAELIEKGHHGALLEDRQLQQLDALGYLDQ